MRKALLGRKVGNLALFYLVIREVRGMFGI